MQTLSGITRRRGIGWLVAGCVGLNPKETPAMNELPSPTPDACVQHPSPLGFEATLARLEAALAQAGLTVFARIDHAAGAAQVGLTMPPTVVLVYGSPRGGTPLMRADPLLALDLPLRVLVHQASDGRVAIVYHPVAATLQRPGVDPVLWQRLEPAQQLLVRALDP